MTAPVVTKFLPPPGRVITEIIQKAKTTVKAPKDGDYLLALSHQNDKKTYPKVRTLASHLQGMIRR